LYSLFPALLAGLVSRGDDPKKPGDPPAGPLSPREEMATFRLAKGFRVELMACEPAVIDPVSMAFDENGRLFVAEMRAYPNEGVGTGIITSGRIKLLEDRDGDGVYETSTVWADNLRLPTGMLPYKGGLIVTDAPQIVYLEDTKNAGKADRRTVLYEGFGLANIQQMINSPMWGLDNWVHGCAGSNGGAITTPQKSGAKPADLRGSRCVRFRPDVLGSLEPTSGGGQYGISQDDWGNWFTSTNSQHLRHIVLPDHYLRRNPLLPVSAVSLDIPDHGSACQVNRISPFEKWRVERTTRRAEGPDAARFPSTELVPGGYITSGCSALVYTADVFPPAYRGNTFVCDPANNLVHRDVLEAKGATFIAKRGEEGSEFFASTDTWCRPVHLHLGPNGAIYVLDFYREAIETPLSLPDDIKKKMNLESRGRGRIWRIVADTPEAEEARKRRPALGKATSPELVPYLADGNRWWRITAQRLLVERQDRTAIKPLKEMTASSKSALGRLHAVCALEGMNELDEMLIETALKDADAGVREQALRLAEKLLPDSARVRSAAVQLVDDPSPRVRFQLAFTLGEANWPEGVAALAKLARRDDNDTWTQTAILSSTHRGAADLLHVLATDATFTRGATPARLDMLKRVAALAGARMTDVELARALNLLGDGPAEPWQAALLAGLSSGLQNSSRSLARLWDAPPTELKEAVGRARRLFEQASATARDSKHPAEDRAAAAQLLGLGPFVYVAAATPELLQPANPPEVQLAAVRALAPHARPEVAEMLLASWSAYGPTVRREALETMLARPERVAALLTAVEQKKVPPSQIEPVRVEQLRKHPDAKVRQRAVAVFAGVVAPDRRKVVDAYQSVLELKSDAVKGKAVFKKTCATCHRLENEGIEVGPDLLSALRNKSPEQLLVDILDPSREVDSRYLNYQVLTRQGRVVTGMLAADTAASITLRRGEKAEDIILRTQIDTIEATSKSLMPEGLEQQLSKQDVADVIGYLRSVAAPKK
jgi:putative membrane-bound dehydrogenase-like protein